MSRAKSGPLTGGPGKRAYVLGHSDHERRRLALQASMIAPHTWRFFVEAGITTGMRVLDLGCGVGDVSILLGHLVGKEGSVRGLDFDAASLAVARGRAENEGLTQLVFEEANATAYRTEERFDAVAGRLILQHVQEPVEVLRHAATLAKPGGILAFQDATPSFNIPSWPPCPRVNRGLELIAKFAVEAIPQHQAGMKLYHWFMEAGLGQPRVQTVIGVEGGPDSVYYEWLAETLRSIMPRAVLLGFAAPDEFDFETLASEFRDEAVRNGAPINAAILTGVFARTAA